MTTSPFRVLVVCHGNISRSPTAQHLLCAALDERFQIASAGVGAYMVAGRPVDPMMAALLEDRDIDVTGHAARQLDRSIINDAELILTMERKQRSWIAEETPRAISHTFTLKEFARLCVAVRDTHPASISALIHAAATNRAVYPPDNNTDDDIADPYHRPTHAYTTALDEIQAAINQIAPELLRHAKLRSKLARNPFADFVITPKSEN
ncbi:MAG: hypothetical protein LBI99_03890 [Propionibacteriaceae bacterium]|jgi:protein-tyrosine phosphatase|nr:hypothetical protein [Propionibacteriaceae bacterium]